MLTKEYSGASLRRGRQAAHELWRDDKRELTHRSCSSGIAASVIDEEG
jgi:hypothetical protein